MTESFEYYGANQLKSLRNHMTLFNKVTGERFNGHLQVVQDHTMLSVERLYDIYLSVNYLNDAEIDGDIVEIGVWKGGALGMALLSDSRSHRKVIGFDTFQGHFEPSELELDIRGNSMRKRYRELNDRGEKWAYAEYEECLSFLTGIERYWNVLNESNPNRINLVKGDVKKTSEHFPETKIALLRIDVDWYAETIASLKKFWPMLEPKGILIMDDYGHHLGAKKAFDEFFSHNPQRYTHIDYSCISVQKME